ncbi:MAG TPA: hypothetical protein VK786_03595 [bacterium]|jgi:hypothetical protein|nr:hypothetical protein [bacterium]
MNVSQNVSAIFNSPQIAELALQSVQAAELAERQGLATLRLESERREHQVTDPEKADQMAGVEAGVSGRPLPEPRTAGRRIRAGGGGPEESVIREAAGDGHRIDLLA